MPEIVLINRYRPVRDSRWIAAIPTIQEYVSNSFAPVWGVDAKIGFCGLHDDPAETAWKVWLLNKSDDPGALGYHDLMNAVPESKIFVGDDLHYGASLTVTVVHEILEMLADPSADKTVYVEGKLVALEVCDAVEADEDGAVLNGLRMSNFVYPARFKMQNPPGFPSNQYDHMGLLKNPFPELRPGGYDLWSDGKIWHTSAARFVDGTLSHRVFKPDGRSARRAAVAI